MIHACTPDTKLSHCFKWPRQRLCAWHCCLLYRSQNSYSHCFFFYWSGWMAAWVYDSPLFGRSVSTQSLCVHHLFPTDLFPATSTPHTTTLNSTTTTTTISWTQRASTTRMPRCTGNRSTSQTLRARFVGVVDVMVEVVVVVMVVVV